jgi:hypothetical protein
MPARRIEVTTDRGDTPGFCLGVVIADRICRKGLYPLVDELAADGIAVATACRVLKLARQHYYGGRWEHRVTTLTRPAAT